MPEAERCCVPPPLRIPLHVEGVAHLRMLQDVTEGAEQIANAVAGIMSFSWNVPTDFLDLLLAWRIDRSRSVLQSL